MDEKIKVKYPAKYLAHWVTGPVACCHKHCTDIAYLGKLMGSTVPVSENLDETLECQNCINESKK